MELEMIQDPAQQAEALVPPTLSDWCLEVFQQLPDGHLILRDVDTGQLGLYAPTFTCETALLAVKGLGYDFLYALPATLPPLP